MIHRFLQRNDTDLVLTHLLTFLPTRQPNRHLVLLVNGVVSVQVYLGNKDTCLLPSCCVLLKPSIILHNLR